MSGRAQLRDQELLMLIGQGDEQALGALYDRYGCLVYSIALHVTKDRCRAEAVTEDVFHSVWMHVHGARAGAASPVVWIIGLTRQRAIAEIRSCHGIGHQVWRDRLSVWPDRPGADGEVPTALARLPQEQRQAMDLAYFHGLTTAEIASVADIPMPTVKSRLRYGLATLGHALRHGTRQAQHEVAAPEQQV